ncbi:unnamed protein product [Brassicogethes aeneus]|uniref:Fas-binding factor 1 C-terminal domain-containing protein n=1 Tax=Brassicogethes aeneus TaxID=1431903 RepID=A0A9P0ASQ0_BRAAE|nr:unnamed protein product [Brassicogethes aeneus]
MDLSDESDDSFFDDPKVLQKRTSVSRTPEKKVSDLFNLGEDTLKKTDVIDDIFPSLDSTLKTTGMQNKKHINFDDDDDILGTMGLDKKKSGKTVKSVKKTDILEGILSTKPEEKKILTFEDILKESKAKKEESTKNVEPSFFHKPVEKISQPFSISDSTREGRRSRRPSGSLVDPLGLFETKKEEPQKNEAEEKKISIENKEILPPKEFSKSTTNVSDLPDWLGGAHSKLSKSEPAINQNHEPPTIAIKKTKETEEIRPTEAIILNKSIESNEMFTNFLQTQKLSQSDLETQSSFLSLQQQESQLLMALQLKKYEESLTDIQKKQQEVLVKQEKQFNMILDRYMLKQQNMENNMKIQQERINNHIQMLLVNTPSVRSEENMVEEEMNKLKKDESVKGHEKIVEALKTRHGEEMFLTEESYKKQIQLLEQSLEKLEERLMEDMKSLTESYEDKLRKLKEFHEEENIIFEERYKKLQENHETDLVKIKENHSRIIDDIKNDHATQLEVLKQMKNYEGDLYKNSNIYSQKLDQSIGSLNDNSQTLLNLQQNMHEKFSVLTVARENSLQAKEKEINLMRESLEKCRESAELERSQLLGLVKSLEMKIAEQHNVGKEERWALQQASSTLAARSAALEREFEFNKASMEREREQLKTLKETTLAEQERMFLQLNEEKLQIAAEKSRLETTAKLNVDFNSQRMKAEIEAAIEVAKESAEMTDRERDNLQRQQIEVEKLKRSLTQKENKLKEKEDELRQLSYEAERRSEEAEKAIRESKNVEAKFKDRMKDLQVQLFSLSTREKKLSEEKIALSRERLSLYGTQRNKKRCSLCEADNNMEGNFEPEMPNIFEDGNKVRFDLHDEDKNSEVSREDFFINHN